MKKFYTMLLTAVLAMVCGFGAQAQVEFTLNCDRDGAVMWKDGYGAEWQICQAGDNTVSLTNEYYGTYYFIVSPVDGYALEGEVMVSASPDDYDDAKISDPLDTNTYYVDSSWAGRKYTVTTKDLNATRSAAMVVDIKDDASKVSFRRKGGKTVYMYNTGETEIKFDPETETPIQFYASGEAFYSFTLNGEKVTPDGTTYSVTPADGDRVEIEVKYPDMDVDVTINVAEGMENAISKFEKQDGYWYSSCDYKLNETFKVKAGARYKVTFNTSEYVITSAKLNGEEKSSTYSLDFFVGTDPVVVDIEAEVKEVMHFFLRTERAGEAKYDLQGYGTYTDLEAGDNMVKPTESYWGGGYNTVYLKAANDFKITRVYCEEAEDEIAVQDDPTNSISLNVTDAWLKRVYVVETMNLNDLRSASVKVTVTDDPAAVVRAQRGSGDFALGAAGETVEVKFNPETESVFSFSGQSVPLREVRLNGEPVDAETSSSTTHQLTVKDGDEIVITAGYDDIDVPVVIYVPEEAASVVRKVETGSTYPYTAVEWTPNEPFYVKAGTRVNIDYNRDAANLKEVKINGVVTGDTYSSMFFVKQDPVEVELDAAPFGTLKFTLNVTDPSHIALYFGTSNYNATPVELTGTSNALEIPEKTGCVKIMPTKGNLIRSVTDGEGNPAELYGSYYTDVYTVTDGMTLNVESAPIDYDGKFVVWIDSSDNVDLASSYWIIESDRLSYNYFEHDGFSVIPFSSEANEEHQLTFYGKDYTRVYLNGELSKESTMWGNTIYYYYTPSHNDVVRVYAGGVEPEKHLLTFNVVGDAAEELKNTTVTTDLLQVQDKWVDGLTLLHGTRVDLALPEGVEGVSVKLDGEDLAADENGNYSFSVTGAHEVTMSASSGITGVDAEDGADAMTVYNLQGIKVLENATKADLRQLPAGIYIVNGEKKAVPENSSRHAMHGMK